MDFAYAERYTGGESKADDVSSRSIFSREAQVLSGVFSGAAQRVEEMTSDWSTTGLQVAAAAGAGVTLNALMHRGGYAAQFAKGALMGLCIADLAIRGVNTGVAMYDTAANPNSNLDLNKKIVGDNLGRALIDYPVMMGAGWGGARLHGFMSPINTRFTADALHKPSRNLIEIDPGKSVLPEAKLGPKADAIGASKPDAASKPPVVEGGKNLPNEGPFNKDWGKIKFEFPKEMLQIKPPSEINFNTIYTRQSKIGPIFRLGGIAAGASAGHDILSDLNPLKPRKLNSLELR
jgi:hypothetical protein